MILLRIIMMASIAVSSNSRDGYYYNLYALNIGAPLAISVAVSCDRQKPQESLQDRRDRKSTDSFVVLTIKLHEDSTTEIVRATQVDGKLIERQVPATKYVYEITKEGKAYSVGFLPEGTFALRGFRDQHHATEKMSETRSATITLNIPDSALDSAKQGKFGLRIYKLNMESEVEAISPDALEKLASKGKASIQYELSGTAMASQVRQKTQTVPGRPD